MPIHNTDIAEIFNRVADFLELEEANQFRIRAYRNAARTVGSLSRSVSDMIEQNEDLSELPGIGKDLAGKITEIVETGTLKQLKELEKRLPSGLLELMTIADLGPKRVVVLHKELGINTLEELEKAAREEKIRQIQGFGEKTEQNIIEALQRQKGGEAKPRIKLIVAEEITQPLLEYLRNVEGVKKVIAAGSYRRRRETVGDLDILVTCKESSKVMEQFVEYEDVQKVISKGETRSSVLLRSNFQVDVRVVAEESYGAALHYFTGSKAHNIAVRRLAQKRDLKVNEYGVFKNDKRVAGKSEEDVYATVELPYIEPELRENRGEIETAREGSLPELITLEDIRGDLQSHTTYTDGKFTLEEMVEAAKNKGYDYLAITDHSKRVYMAKGLDAKRLAEQLEEVEKLNEELKDFRILKSSEVDILEDGSLDLPDDILKALDVVVCSIHYNFKLSREKQTERIIRGMDNPYFNIFAHPTGRLIGQREPYDLDLERIMEAAKERGCFLELNAQPERLDLSDVHVKMAKEMGIKIAISTDAHTISDLDYMRFGIGEARRGWLEPDDVLNTQKWNDLKKLLTRT
ncbi:DNA polymerase/3'-5' exonuclease PolX [candidate division KSB1 bacterium]|nr:DNA polymerase/3'-5' exonuclease PolX [candidate division KSB1 bacterium]NIR68513.1 DNA polymerase/3'-5' exonuclease PolX [candidate division KSB1 bacterium]NIS22527.1 DNA polymerase/3'-5' exonuclease PolX [candidate division KSB1 bacterium]NIT69371.1 DNA polymerase/3'-5' exonuclease PolX [candidate division KSB1 bacterium]NIU23032.1 DNA polymerase/3'-5' exonuclease PolX [candidate division KSB1 bacterium]